jgi:lysozyme family protein
LPDINFATCMAFVFSAEGGYVDNPNDPGGATNMGITLDVLSAWRHSAASKADVQSLTKDEATAIYRANYWNVLRGGSLPGGADLMVFDAGVNMGTGRSAKLLQTIVGVTDDGAIGPATLAAITDYITANSAASLIGALASARSDFYHSLSSFDVFGAGWLNRVAKVQALAQELPN